MLLLLLLVLLGLLVFEHADDLEWCDDCELDPVAVFAVSSPGVAGGGGSSDRITVEDDSGGGKSTTVKQVIESSFLSSMSIRG